MLDSRSLPELAPEAHQDQGWASLAGKLYDDRGNRMGPSHAAKGGQRWRYYISRALLKGRKSDAGPVSRVPVAQIEKQVFDAVKLVQRRRDKAAAVKLMRKLLKKQSFAPDVLVTDRLRSYGAAKAEIGLSARHERGLRKNNRAENSHERKMQRFKIARISSTLLVHSRRRPKHVQRPAASHIPPHAPPLPRRSFPDVASCYRSLNLSLGLPIFALAKFGSRENAPWRTGRRRQPTTYQGHGDGYQSRSKNRTLWGYCPERAAWGGFKLIRVAQARAFVHSRF